MEENPIRIKNNKKEKRTIQPARVQYISSGKND
jgi:hypothetical protein